MGKAWKVLRSVLNKNEKNKNPSTFVVDGEIINDPATISNKFNNYFVEIGPKLTKNLNSSIDPFNYLNNNTSSIFFPEISENEILLTVNSLKNASAGWDHIPTFIAKRSLQYYLKPYIDSFNQ